MLHLMSLTKILFQLGIGIVILVHVCEHRLTKVLFQLGIGIVVLVHVKKLLRRVLFFRTSSIGKFLFVADGKRGECFFFFWINQGSVLITCNFPL